MPVADCAVVAAAEVSNVVAEHLFEIVAAGECGVLNFVVLVVIAAVAVVAVVG